MTGRAPVPDWHRPGETWRIEGEPGWYPVAWRYQDHFGLCRVHLEAGHMWIENGKVVSWALRP
jgi:hypothetical protein